MGLITQYREKDFSKGINHYDKVFEKTGVYFDILLMDENDRIEICEPDNEIAILIINGSGKIDYNNSTSTFNRENWIDDDPTVVHLGPNERAIINSNSFLKPR